MNLCALIFSGDIITVVASPDESVHLCLSLCVVPVTEAVTEWAQVNDKETL